MNTKAWDSFMFFLLNAIGMSVVSSVAMSVTLPTPETYHAQGYSIVTAISLFLPGILFYLLSAWAISALIEGWHKAPQYALWYKFVIFLITLLPFSLMQLDVHLWLAALVASFMLLYFARFLHKEAKR